MPRFRGRRRAERGYGEPARRRHDVRVPTDARDRVLDWQEELRRIEPRLLELPVAARQAIREVVQGFLREDADAADVPLLRAA
jgi:hypothetical protein